jgi:cytochrome P450
VATLHRTTTKEYNLSNGSTIPEKTGVIIPILAIHRDPEYFPDPLNFDPSRFSEENKKSRHPFTWMPFGEGELYTMTNFYENYFFFLLKDNEFALECVLDKYKRS